MAACIGLPSGTLEFGVPLFEKGTDAFRKILTRPSLILQLSLQIQLLLGDPFERVTTPEGSFILIGE